MGSEPAVPYQTSSGQQRAGNRVHVWMKVEEERTRQPGPRAASDSVWPSHTQCGNRTSPWSLAAGVPPPSEEPKK